MTLSYTEGGGRVKLALRVEHVDERPEEVGREVSPRPVFAATDLRRLAASLFVAHGASGENAAAVADHLVESDLGAVHSHGLIRVPQYIREIKEGELDPAATPLVESEAGARVSLDGRRAFGQVAATAAVDAAGEAVRAAGVAVVTVRRAGHAGRIGAYTEALARAGHVALAFCSGPRSGHRVVPYGGTEGRLATNPISYAYPAEPEPVVADFSTSAAPEGHIRVLRDRGVSAPADVLQTAEGSATTDPWVLYREPLGTLLPLGGTTFGHKGYGLAVLVEAMATLLAGEDTTDERRSGNNLALVAVATDVGFAERAVRLGNYLRSSRPIDPARPVLLPGDRERLARRASGAVSVDTTTWSALVALAAEHRLDVPAPLGEEEAESTPD
jgi:uncharacterized oxidoreductase